MSNNKVSVSADHFTDISAIRGIAALLVVVFHLQVHLFEGYPDRPIDEYSMTWWLFLGFFDLGKYAVALFFLVSGFLIPATLRGPDAAIRKFVTRRFFRLYPAYWFSILFGAMVLVLLDGQSQLSASQLLANATMLPRLFGEADFIGVYWTLQIELCFYVVCIALAAVGALHRYAVWNTLALVAALAVAAARAWTGIALPVAIPIALALMFFADGMRMRGDVRMTKPFLIDIVRTAGLLVPVCLIGYGDAGPRYVVTYWAAIATFILCRRYGSVLLATATRQKVAELLGDSSYSVYLIGSPLMQLVAVPLFAVTGSRVLSAVVLLAALLFSSRLIFNYLEAPCIQLGKRLSGKHRPPAPTPASGAPSGVKPELAMAPSDAVLGSSAHQTDVTAR